MHRRLRRFFSVGAAALLAAGAAAPAPALARHAKKQHHHAQKHAAPAVTGRLATRIRLGDGLRTYQPSRHQLGVRYAPGVNDDTPSSQVHFVVDRAVLRRYLTGLADVIRRHPVDARPVVAEADADDDGTKQVPAKIVPGHSGAALEVDAAVDAVQKAIESDPGTKHVVLPVKVKPAQVTAKDLQGINARVGYFVTRFNPGDVGRTMTVRRAISIIDGHVLMPGAEFSVDKVVGPRDPAHGFTGKGHVFINGHMEMQSGGGMCQVGTTLFNAVMMADLKITERHQHVRTVPYIPPGRDATIYHGQKDFRFVNDTDAPVYISYRTTRSHAIVSLFGKAVPGRKVRLIGHSRQLAERHYTGMFSRVVHEPDGTVQRGPTFYSDYKWPETLDYSR
ncbi:MAG: VanW family protein [Armatimonadetes bacterium]|nr:VanW family protein [Armatimonadota bacterium]